MTPRLLLLPLAFALVATVTFAAVRGRGGGYNGEGDGARLNEPARWSPSSEYGGTISAIVNFKNEGIDPYYRYTAGALDRADQRATGPRRLDNRAERVRLYHDITCPSRPSPD